MAGGREGAGLVGFDDGNKVGLLPYCRDGSTIVGEVIKVVQDVEAPRTQMAEVPDGQAIWALCGGVSSLPYSLGYRFGSEIRSVKVYGMKVVMSRITFLVSGWSDEGWVM